VVLVVVFVSIRRKRHKPVLDVALDRAAERAAHHDKAHDGDAAARQAPAAHSDAGANGDSADVRP
jgi:hypothetical protein